jgi:hypothetical protein
MDARSDATSVPAGSRTDQLRELGAILERRVRAGATPRVRLLAAALGYGITAVTIAWSLTQRGLGADLAVWDRVGDEVRAGIDPYYHAAINVQNFFYAPPLALVFGATSWLPIVVQAGCVFAIELVCLRYVAGSWMRVGYLGLIPITGGELVAGSFNFVIAAGLLASMRGDPRLTVIGALSKLSPVLAIRDWRRAIPITALALAVTIPVASWWASWVQELQYGATLGLGFPVPLVLRVAVALALVAWRPRSRRVGALAAAIAIPGLYSYSIVLLYPLLRSDRTSDPAPA